MTSVRTGFFVDARKFIVNVCGLVVEWKLLCLFLVWCGFFSFSILLLLVPSWKFIVVKAIGGATSLQFLLLITAGNTLMVLAACALSASKHYGWPAFELRLVRFSVEAGVALTAYGFITACVVIPIVDVFSLKALSALFFFPLFLTLYSICLFVMADDFQSRPPAALDSVSKDERSAGGFGRLFSTLACLLIVVAITLSIICVFPKVSAPIVADYESSTGTRSGQQRAETCEPGSAESRQ